MIYTKVFINAGKIKDKFTIVEQKLIFTWFRGKMIVDFV